MRRRRLLGLAIVMSFALLATGCTIDDFFSGFPGLIVVPMPGGGIEIRPGDGATDPGEPGDPSDPSDPSEPDPSDPDPGQDPDPGADPWTIETGWIRADSSRFKTPYYVITAAEPGPTLFIVGGTHGNEPAGYTAAQRIVDELRPDKGRIVVIPRANAAAVAAGTRGVSDLPDLARRFTLGGAPVGKTANEIWDLILEYEPDWFLDLHEGYDFYIKNKNSVGQSVIYYPTGRAYSDARALVDYLNGMPAVRNGRTERFTLIRNPISGSMARKVGQDLGIPAATIETCLKDPLERRVGFHMYAVRFIAAQLGMTLQ